MSLGHQRKVCQSGITVAHGPRLWVTVCDNQSHMAGYTHRWPNYYSALIVLSLLSNIITASYTPTDSITVSNITVVHMRQPHITSTHTA